MGVARVVSVNVASPILAFAERMVLRTMVAMWASSRVKLIAGAEAQGITDELHEQGKEAMRGPERLAWLEGAKRGPSEVEE